MRPVARSLPSVLLLGAALLALGACGAPNTPPVADAGPDRSVRVGERATFDASDSRDPDGDVLEFAWTLAERPDGSTADLQGSDGATPTLTPDAAGDYRLELSVGDGRDADSDGATLSARANAAPALALDLPDTVEVGATVTASATASDPDGDEIALSWDLSGRPAGSAAEFAVAGDGASATFTADLAGSYGVRVTADDGARTSEAVAAVRAEATVPNRVPTADAGPDIEAEVGGAAPLDGSASSDLDGDPLAVVWTVLSWPAGSAEPTPADPGALVTTLPVEAAGDYLVELTVDDGSARDSDRLVIRASAATPVPDTIVHAAPDGDDAASGAAAAPVRTLARALAIAAADPAIDRIELAAGSYPAGPDEPYDYVVASDVDIVGAGRAATRLEPAGADVLTADGATVKIVALEVVGADDAFGVDGGGLLFVQDVRCEAQSCVGTLGSSRAFVDASRFVGGGSGNGVTGLGGAVNVQNSTISGFATGVALLAADAAVNASVLDGNGRGLYALGNGVAPVGVRGSSFGGNGSGIVTRAASLRLTDVTVADSDRYGLDLERSSADGVSAVRLTVLRSGFSGVRVRGEELTLDDGELALNGRGSPNDATDRAGLRVESGAAFLRGTLVRGSGQDNVAVLGGLFDAAQVEIRDSGYAAVYATGEAVVNVEGSELTDAFNGLYVRESAAVALDGALLRDLGGDGVNFGSDAGLRVRDSVFRAIASDGVQATSTAGAAAIDLGTPTDAGGNEFDDSAGTMDWGVNDGRPARAAADGPILEFHGNRMRTSSGSSVIGSGLIREGPASRSWFWRIANANVRLRD